MAQKILGIDLGSYAIKVSLIERYLRDFEIVAYQEQILNQSHRLTAEEASAAALRSVLEKGDFAADITAVSLPTHHLSCRVLELPFTNIKKIEQTVGFELESYIPVALDELLLDYHILAIEENRSLVLTAYVPRLRFAKYLDLLQAAGVDAKYMGVDAIDFSHIAQVAMVPQEGVYVLLDIGHQKTNLCVMDGSKLIYVRPITIAGLHFTRAIQKAFHLNFEKADGLKLDRGRVSNNQEKLDQISRLCQTVAEELIVAIRQTYLGFKKIYPQKDWQAIYATGGGSKMAGLLDLLSSSLCLNVSSIDFLDFVNHHLDKPELCRDSIVPSVAETIKVVFSNRAIKINFRRGEFGYQRDLKAIGSEIKWLGVWFSLVFVIGITYYFFSYNALSSRVAKADDNIVKTVAKALPEFKQPKKGKTKNLIDIINGKIAEIRPQLEALEEGAGKKGPLDLLLDISRVLPPKNELVVDMDEFNYTGEVIRLDGRTNSFEGVDTIKTSLEKSSHFKNVTTRKAEKGLRDEIKFSISMDVAGEADDS